METENVSGVILEIFDDCADFRFLGLYPSRCMVAVDPDAEIWNTNFIELNWAVIRNLDESTWELGANRVHGRFRPMS